jgi:hypothetical protein
MQSPVASGSQLELAFNIARASVSESLEGAPEIEQLSFGTPKAIGAESITRALTKDVDLKMFFICTTDS